MDKLAEHVGLYDIWTVFFPGIVGILETLCFMGAMRGVCSTSGFKEIKVFVPQTLSEWIVVIIFSVFFGLVFQEIGRKMRKVFKLKNAAKDIFKPGTELFEEKEITPIKRALIQKGWNDQMTFNWINAQAQDKRIAPRYVKLSVIQNMSLSLASTMLIGAVEGVVLFVHSIIKGAGGMMIVSGIAIVICIFLLIMFIKRSERFNRYWVKSLVYAVATSNTGGKPESVKLEP